MIWCATFIGAEEIDGPCIDVGKFEYEVGIAAGIGHGIPKAACDFNPYMLYLL